MKLVGNSDRREEIKSQKHERSGIRSFRGVTTPDNAAVARRPLDINPRFVFTVSPSFDRLLGQPTGPRFYGGTLLSSYSVRRLNMYLKRERVSSIVFICIFVGSIINGRVDKVFLLTVPPSIQKFLNSS